MSCIELFSLGSHKTAMNFNIFKIKNADSLFIKQENILKKLIFINTFEEISKWVETCSKGKKFIANPSNASDTDRLDCLFAVQKPIFLALQKIKKRRKNGRDRRLIEANNANDYAEIANVLASTAGTYWRDHKFLSYSKKNDLKNKEF